MTGRQNISSGTPWEATAGYSRAVRIGQHVWVAGTTASDQTGAVQSPGDAYGQAIYIIRKIERALIEAGATLSDVVRTRVYITNTAYDDDVMRAHGAIFGAIRPANTMIAISGLTTPDHWVEIEMDAFIQG